MNRIISKLKEKSGAGMITPAIAVIISVMFLLLLSNLIYLYSMIMGLSDYIQEAVIQTAASNAYNAYKGIRDGNSSAHTYAGDGAWSEVVSTSEVSTRLRDMLQMERLGNRLYKEKDGVLRYAISDIDVRCNNVSVGDFRNTARLTFKVSAVAEIPMSFMGAQITVRKPITLTSYYTPKF